MPMGLENGDLQSLQQTQRSDDTDSTVTWTMSANGLAAPGVHLPEGDTACLAELRPQGPPL
jgi:hypothetical protein